MRVVNFWTMCHHSLGHEKKALLSAHFLIEVQWLGTNFLKLINYSCSSYPTRAPYSGQVDEFRNPMKTELKTRLSSAAVFSTRFSLDF